METMAGCHTTLGCELIWAEMPSWADLVSASSRDLWGNLWGCWRKWWWQHCRWYPLFSSDHWVSNRCDGSEQDFLAELWAWCETTVLSSGGCLKTTTDFVWKVELVTLGYRPRFSISLSYVVSPNYSNTCSSLGQQNKPNNVTLGCWSTEKVWTPLKQTFTLNPVINLNEFWITSRLLNVGLQ